MSVGWEDHAEGWHGSTLWQVIEKEHMESNTDEVISDDEWYAFVEFFNDGFADAVSQLAADFWRDRNLCEEWKEEWKEILGGEEE